MQIDAFRHDARVGEVIGPGGGRRRSRRVPGQPGLYGRDQLALPVQALDLPDPQRREAGGEGQAEGEEGEADQTPPSTGGGAMGIMFPCRWNMIHSEPQITIRIMMAVKTSATRVQPPSLRVFTCRK